MTNESVFQTDWGYEVRWASGNNYAGKILVFHKTGNKTSLHFHQNKDKSYFVNSGKFKVRWVDTKTGQLYEQELKEGGVWNNPALQPCSLEALQDNSSISEVNNSSNEEDVFHIVPAKNIG